jgi:hypothetical protein
VLRSSRFQREFSSVIFVASEPKKALVFFRAQFASKPGSCVPTMLSGANAFEISNIQETKKSPLNLALGM